MTLNPLSIFYRVPDRWQLHPSGYAQVSWKCDPTAVHTIIQAGNLDFTDLAVTNLVEVNSYFDRVLLIDRELISVIVHNLYQAALNQQPIRNNCWFNFIEFMTIKAAVHTWRKVPKSQQSEELFDQLIAPNLTVEKLLHRFDPNHRANLLIGLQAWTYKVVKYRAFAAVRANGNPYFGLSNLGVVSRSSYILVCEALTSNVSTDCIDSYKSIYKVFKNYLAQSEVSVNQLEVQHWQKIATEINSLLSINLTVAELRSWIELVGSLIRAQTIPKIESYDDPNRSRSVGFAQSIIISHQPSPLISDIDDSRQLVGQLFTIVDQFMSSLAPETQKIFTLRHHQKLKQNEIAAMIARDQDPIQWETLSQADIKKSIKNIQPIVSRRLGEGYFNLLDHIHAKVPHPDGNQVIKNSLAINAAKQLLDQYFSQVQSLVAT
jgi:hypothetical protein